MTRTYLDFTNDTQIRQAVDKLEGERDDLLAALRLLLNCFEPDERRFYIQRLGGDDCRKSLEFARDAIASATTEKP